MNKDIHIGKKIQNVIENSNKSVQDISVEMNTTSQNIYSLYKKKHISTKYLIALSEVLNISISVFFDNEISDKQCKERVKSALFNSSELNKKLIIRHLIIEKNDYVWYKLLVLLVDLRDIKSISFRNEDISFFVFLRLVNNSDFTNMKVFVDYIKAQKQIADWKYLEISKDKNELDKMLEIYRDFDNANISKQIKTNYIKQKEKFKIEVVPILKKIIAENPVYHRVSVKGWLKGLYDIDFYSLSLYYGFEDILE